MLLWSASVFCSGVSAPSAQADPVHPVTFVSSCRGQAGFLLAPQNCHVLRDLEVQPHRTAIQREEGQVKTGVLADVVDTHSMLERHSGFLSFLFFFLS